MPAKFLVPTIRPHGPKLKNVVKSGVVHTLSAPAAVITTCLQQDDRCVLVKTLLENVDFEYDIRVFALVKKQTGMRSASEAACGDSESEVSNRVCLWEDLRAKKTFPNS